jgi:CheY-like chemotaxis protein
VNVLLVEDHDDTRFVMSKLLTLCGHYVVVAENFACAAQLLTHLKFDVLVSDLGLPDRDGLELPSVAKKHQPLKMSVALTARSSQEDRQKALQAGFDHFMTKPFDFPRLRSLLNAESLIS